MTNSFSLPKGDRMQSVPSCLSNMQLACLAARSGARAQYPSCSSPGPSRLRQNETRSKKITQEMIFFHAKATISVTISTPQRPLSSLSCIAFHTLHVSVWMTLLGPNSVIVIRADVNSSLKVDITDTVRDTAAARLGTLQHKQRARVSLTARRAGCCWITPFLLWCFVFQLRRSYRSIMTMESGGDEGGAGGG